ncbi:hypothetical protein [uncultured Sphingomonas sp.]|uniref:hypothetical protein n=1 Tax=uncultured Sphingomonas sp. TaxID=158754 RepID=UPI0025D0EA0F|nr:hypothetical protein [uncultured Sphingomonas sp.]
MADPHAHLIRHLIARTDGTASVPQASWRPWCSATFSGARHRIRLAAPLAAADWLTEHLEEMEFAIPGHVVAEIALDNVQMQGELLMLDIAALTVEQA